MIRMANIQNTDNINADEVAKQQEFCFIVGGDAQR